MNLISNSKYKKRVVSTLFLYLIILLSGCDFKSPEEWETPGWYTDLTLPLINKEFSFVGLLSDTIFYSDTLNIALPSDTVNNVLHVTYPVLVPAQSIPDSIFNIDMSSVAMDMPDIGINDTINIPLPDISDSISIPINVDMSTYTDCFPEDLLDSLSFDNEDVEIKLPNYTGISTTFSIKSLTADSGKWIAKVGNNFPFSISAEFSVTHGETIFYTTFDSLYNITSYDEKSSSKKITVDKPETINLGTPIIMHPIIRISDDQKVTDCEIIVSPEVYICNISSEQFISEDACRESCAGICVLTPSITKPGWIIDTAIISGVALNIEYVWNNITNIVIDFYGIQKTKPIEIRLPGFDGFTIKKARLDSSTQEYPNKLSLDINNNTLIPLNLQFDFPNLYSYNNGWTNLSDNFMVAPNSSIDPENRQIDFSEATMVEKNNPDAKFSDLIPIYTIIVDVTYEMEALDNYTLIVTDNKATLGMEINFVIENMNFEYIAAITHKLDFPVSASPSIGMPDGFTDVEFMDFIMKIELINQINIPMDIELKIQGIKGVEEGVSVPLNTVIGVPNNYNTYENATHFEDSVCVFNNIDSVRTLIITKGDFQIIEFYCNPSDTEPPKWQKYLALDTIFVDESSNRFVDLLNYFPEKINVSGLAEMNGDGILLKGADIGGTFTLESPLSLIFKKRITIIPADPWPLEPMDDPETSEKINSSLISGDFFVDITNRSSLGGSLSLLISDSTIFPLFLDSLITGTWEQNRQHQMTKWEYYFITNPESDTNQPWIWDSLGMEIDSISFIAIDPSDDESKALQVKFFYEDSLQFFVGRMFEIVFPPTDSIDYNWGYAIPAFPGLYSSSVKLDTTILSWLITDEPRNSTAMIMLDGSPFQVTDSTYTPVTLQTTNAIEVQAYLTLKLDTGGLIE